MFTKRNPVRAKWSTGVAATWLLLASSLALGAGCGGRPALLPVAVAQAPERAPRGEAPAPRAGREAAMDVDDSDSAPAAGVAAESSARARRDSAGDDSYRHAPPAARPGLATEWGETRTSYSYDQSFTRLNGDNPYQLEVVHYNDRAGVLGTSGRQGSGWGVLRSDEDWERGGSDVAVNLVDSDGHKFDKYALAGNPYVVGEAGERYAISLHNRTGRRVEAVVTVDGLDVISGQAGGYYNRGYVLLPYATVEIEGFRRSTHAVAAFRFGAVGDSYAAARGSTRNVGVIGVALFAERNSDDYEDARRRERARPFPAQDPRYAPAPYR